MITYPWFHLYSSVCKYHIKDILLAPWQTGVLLAPWQTGQNHLIAALYWKNGRNRTMCLQPFNTKEKDRLLIFISFLSSIYCKLLMRATFLYSWVKLRVKNQETLCVKKWLPADGDLDWTRSHFEWIQEPLSFLQNQIPLSLWRIWRSDHTIINHHTWVSSWQFTFC